MPTAARLRAWSKDLAYVAKIVNIFVRMIAYHSGHDHPKSSSKIVNIHGFYGGHKWLRSLRRICQESSAECCGPPQAATRTADQ